MQTKQEIWTLIRSLFSSQLVFIMRTHKPSVITELIDDYELFVRQMMERLLEIHVDDIFWEEMQLKIVDGGAGIPHFKYVSYCAYLASISTMEGEIDPVQHEQHYEFLSNRIENAKQS